MGIRIKCKQCGKAATVPDEYAGKRARCPCGAVIAIPAAPGGPAQRQPAEGRGAPPGRPRVARPQSAARAAGGRPVDARRRAQARPSTSSLRLALLGAGFVVLAGLVVAIMLVSRAGGARLDAVARDPLGAVPADATAIAYADLRQLAQSGFFDTFLEASKEDTFGDRGGRAPDLAAFFQSVHLDPKRDLDAAVIVVRGEEPKGVAIVTGHFRGKKMRDTLAERYWRESRYQGYKFLQVHDLQVCVVNNRIVVAGDWGSATKVVDILKGDAKPMDTGSPLLSKGRRLGGQTFWLTAAVDGEKLSIASTEETPMPMPGIDLSKLMTVAFYGKADRHALGLAAELGCQDAPAAEALGEALKSSVAEAAGMVAMMAAGDQEIAELANEFVQSIEIASKNRDATVSLTIKRPLIEKLKKMWEEKSEAVAGEITPPPDEAAPDDETPPEEDATGPEEPKDVDVSSAAEGEDIDAPVALGLTETHVLPTYDERLEERGVIAALDLIRFNNIFVDPKEFDLPPDSDPGEVFSKAGRGHAYLTKKGDIVPLRGTKMAPLKLPGPAPEHPSVFAFVGPLKQMTKRQILEQLESYLDANPESRGRSFVPKRDATYVVSGPGAPLLAMRIVSRDALGLSLVLVPIGEMAACQSQLAEIVRASSQYALGEDGLYPESLQELVQGHFISDSVLTCPADKSARGQKRSYGSLFDLADKRLSNTLPGHVMLVWDNAGHHGGARCVAFADGLIQALSERSFQKHLETAKAHLADPEAAIQPEE